MLIYLNQKVPGREYNNRDVNRILQDGLKSYKGDIAAGKLIYKAALCESCHRMAGEGGQYGAGSYADPYPLQQRGVGLFHFES